MNDRNEFVEIYRFDLFSLAAFCSGRRQLASLVARHSRDQSISSTRFAHSSSRGFFVLTPLTLPQRPALLLASSSSQRLPAANYCISRSKGNAERGTMRLKEARAECAKVLKGRH